MIMNNPAGARFYVLWGTVVDIRFFPVDYASVHLCLAKLQNLFIMIRPSVASVQSYPLPKLSEPLPGPRPPSLIKAFSVTFSPATGQDGRGLIVPEQRAGASRQIRRVEVDCAGIRFARPPKNWHKKDKKKSHYHKSPLQSCPSIIKPSHTTPRRGRDCIPIRCVAFLSTVQVVIFHLTFGRLLYDDQCSDHHPGGIHASIVIFILEQRQGPLFIQHPLRSARTI